MTIEYEEDHLSKEQFFKLHVGDILHCVGESRDYLSWRFCADEIHTGDTIMITRIYDRNHMKAYNFTPIKTANLCKGYRSYYIPKESRIAGYPPPWELLSL